jgi:hypothetical protein
MRANRTHALPSLLIAVALVLGGAVRARAADMKLQAQLLWGTDDAKSPNPAHKPVDAELKLKLKRLPLKWANYFEVTRQGLDVPQNGAKKVVLSDQCEIEVKNLDGTKVEVTHYGKGKRVATRTQALPKGELLVVGGNAPDSTAWLVVIRRND